MMNRAKRTGLWLALILSVAACSSDRTAGLGVAGQVAGAFVPKRGAAPPPPIPFDLTKDLIDATGGDVIMARVAARGLTVPMTLAGRNGDVSTFTAAGIVTLSMRSGVILATRGFGDDLMSAEVPAGAQLTRTGQSYQRVYHLFDGQNQILTLAAQCSTGVAGAERIRSGGRILATRIIAETCQSEARPIENRFWLAPSGRIVRARQWVSPDIGYVETLLPG